MIKRLYLENFALTDKLEIEFDSGMSVLTGETGAGKSIIVGAIARLMGEKADREDIRSGKSMAAIEAEFVIGDREENIPDYIAADLIDLNINFESDILNIRREIFANKASKCFINGQLATLTRRIWASGNLAELYGQHSHQRLLDEKNHLAFLDSFAGTTEETIQMKQLFDAWESTKKELHRLINQRDQKAREQELLCFQKDEITRAKIRIGEEEELLAEKKILDSSQTLAEKSSAILSILDQQEQSALEILGYCRKEFSDMAALDRSLEKHEGLLDQAIINLEELRTEVESYQSSIPDDPARQEEINFRLDEIFRLKKKYGGSEESILASLEKIKGIIGADIDVDGQIKNLQKEEKDLFEKYFEMAREISMQRQKASVSLAKKVEKELGLLGMDSAEFQFEFSYEEDENGIEWENRKIRPTPDGLENGRFLISANPGEPVKPLARIASGGEISRIMLALKAADREKADNWRGLLVFDEIDVGIGGMTANTVAEKLRSLARKYQLLVVTHLHQIAAVSDNHYAVEKVSQKSSGRNIITIRKLGKSERASEIKRMLAIPVSPK